MILRVNQIWSGFGFWILNEVQIQSLVKLFVWFGTEIILIDLDFSLILDPGQLVRGHLFKFTDLCEM